MTRSILIVLIGTLAVVSVGCGSGSTNGAASTAGNEFVATIVADVFPGQTPQPGMLPNAALTPGDVLPEATTAQICTPGYARRVRDVAAEEKRRVYAEYGVTNRSPGEYEVDHLVPLELGGSNDIKNVWPEPAAPKPGFHEKDELETKLHDLVCSGGLDLQSAQHAIASDWLAAYHQIRHAITPYESSSVRRCASPDRASLTGMLRADVRDYATPRAKLATKASFLAGHADRVR